MTETHPLRDAQIVEVEMLDESTVLVGFSNGDSVSIAMEKIKVLALTSGVNYFSSRSSETSD